MIVYPEQLFACFFKRPRDILDYLNVTTETELYYSHVNIEKDNSEKMKNKNVIKPLT